MTLFCKRFGTPNILDSILLIRLQDLYSQVCVLSLYISYSDGNACLLHAYYVPASGLDCLHLKIHIIHIKFCELILPIFYTFENRDLDELSCSKPQEMH